jgi:hypothetical protein
MPKYPVTPAVTPPRNTTVTVTPISSIESVRNTVTKHPKPAHRNSVFLKKHCCYARYAWGPSQLVCGCLDWFCTFCKDAYMQRAIRICE